jgi:hypothetical protein
VNPANPSNPANQGQPQPGDDRRLRLEELLCDRATQGLSASEQAELELLTHDLGLRADESFERAAAALDLALNPAPVGAGQMPRDVYARLLAKGDEWYRQSSDPLLLHKSMPSLLDGLEHHAPAPEIVIPLHRRVARSWPTWGGWAAAAACLAFAALYTTRPIPNPAQPGPIDLASASVPVNPPVQTASILPISPVEAFDRLVNSVSDVLTVSGNATPTGIQTAAQPVTAEFVWSPKDHKGFLTVAGLPPTDNARQYQLWIKDDAREDPYPVDAGTFEIPMDGPKWVIPIEAKLPVYRPKLFAVTVERPGGVVVSSPDRVVLVGEVVGPEDLHGPPSDLAPAGNAAN